MKSKWTAEDIPDHSGKTIIITGANSGLGLASAKALAAKGAHVIMACRSQERGEQALQEVRQIPNASAELMLLDLGSLQSVQDFAEGFQSRYGQLNILLNNAGIMATPYGTTQDGFEKQIGVNHLGHFALTAQLMQLLLRTENSRVVNVSSLAASNGQVDPHTFRDPENYKPWPAYSQSKLANLMFTCELNRRLQGHSTIALAAHPGGASTNLGRNMKTNALKRFLAEKILLPLLPSADQNAAPQLYAATGEEAAGGHYYGPGGMGEIAGAPKRVEMPGTVGGPEEWQRLWVASEELTGLKFSFNPA